MCSVAYPSSFSSVTPAIVDGTPVTGQSWPAPLDENGRPLSLESSEVICPLLTPALALSVGWCMTIERNMASGLAQQRSLSRRSFSCAGASGVFAWACGGFIVMKRETRDSPTLPEL